MSKKWSMNTGLCIWWLPSAWLAFVTDARQQFRLEYESKEAKDSKCDAVGYNHCEVESEAKSIMETGISTFFVFYHNIISLQLHESTSRH